MLDHAAIAERIPHSGRMCLLDRVIHWDARSVQCATSSHRDADNPLREATGLPVWAGIEYAAQAAAVHASLTQHHSSPRAGVLAALRGVTASCARLDEIEGELILDAELLHSDPAGGIFKFAVRSGGIALLSGQFTLMFRGAQREAANA